MTATKPKRRAARLVAADWALGEAAAHVRETGPNTGDRIRFYQAADSYNPVPDTNYPWCASFVVCGFREVGRPLVEIARSASVQSLHDAARAQGWLVEQPARGDIFCYREPGKDAWDDHTGFVLDDLGPLAGLRTVEGNTADAVLVRIRDARYRHACAFIRVPGTVVDIYADDEAVPRKGAPPLPGPSPKPAWFWPAVKEFNRRAAR